MSEHEPVIAGFLNRLVSAVSRSALLKATVSRNGRLLDCSRLDIVDEGLPGRLLECVVSGKCPEPISLQPRTTFVDEGADADGEPTERPAENRYREHRNLYDMLDRRIQRFAELVKRETGVHSLWLGYPFLHVVTGEPDASRSVHSKVPVCTTPPSWGFNQLSLVQIVHSGHHAAAEQDRLSPLSTIEVHYELVTRILGVCFPLAGFRSSQERDQHVVDILHEGETSTA